MKRTDFIYEVQDLVAEHSITLEQAFYCICQVHNIECEISAAEVLPLYQKNLFKNNKINTKVLFRSREEPEQTQMEMTFDSVPKNTDEENLIWAHKLEKKLVIDSHLTDEYKEEIAQKYFKGDTAVARYFIIFKSMFPVRDQKLNAKWNGHYGYLYTGISMWDSHVRVAKRFHEFYRKIDIGLFLAGVYLYSRDVINSEEETCWITKPYKFMSNYEQWYESAKVAAEDAKTAKNKPKSKLPTKGVNVI